MTSDPRMEDKEFPPHQPFPPIIYLITYSDLRTFSVLHVRTTIGQNQLHKHVTMSGCTLLHLWNHSYLCHMLGNLPQKMVLRMQSAPPQLE